MKDLDIDKIVTEYLFSEDGDIFDAIICSDKAYSLLSDENCILLITKRMMETEN